MPQGDGQHGGYRRPERPAATSGPGSLSRRTDGNATQAPQVAAGGAYGERKELEGIQSGAPLAGGGGGVPALTSAAPPMERPQAINAPSARPDEPITTGMNSVPNVTASQIDDTTRERLQAALPTLLWMASNPKASEQTRQWVRQVRADL